MNKPPLNSIETGRPASRWTEWTVARSAGGSRLPSFFSVTPQFAEFLRLVSRWRWLVVLSVSCSLGSALAEGMGIGLLVPLLGAMTAGDAVFENIPVLRHFATWLADWSLGEKMQAVALGLAVVGIVRGALMYGGTMTAQRLAINLDRELKSRIVRQIFAVEYQFIQNRKFTYFLYQLGGFSNSVANLGTHLCNAVGAVLMLSLYAFISLAMSWELTLSAGLMLIFIQRYIRKPLQGRVEEAGKRLNQENIALDTVKLEALGGMKMIRVHDRISSIIERYEAALEKTLVQRWQLKALSNLLQPIFLSSLAIVIALLLFFGAFLPADSTARNIPVLLLFLFILHRLAGQVMSLNSIRLSVAQSAHAIESVFEFLDERDKPYLKNGNTPFNELRVGITFKDVSFRYDRGKDHALQDLDLVMPAHRMTAIIGPSGSGKTTLINLLCRLYDPKVGQILVDGRDLRELDIGSWRSRIAVVSQDIFLFDDSIAANIRFVRPDAADEEVFEAARLADADEFIRGLPDGYDTLIGDRGLRLSGGQQQRLSIARAFLAEPQLLILDEATSHLDSHSEKSIQNAVSILGERCTIIVIAHRLSTIMKSDKIVVLDQGRIVEEGRHSDLLKKRGAYWEMLRLQTLDLLDEDLQEGVKLTGAVSPE